MFEDVGEQISRFGWLVAGVQGWGGLRKEVRCDPGVRAEPGQRRLEAQRKWERKREKWTSNVGARVWDRLPQGGSRGDSGWGRDG